MTTRLTFPYFGEVYMVEMDYPDRESGWQAVSVSPVDEHREWVEEAAIGKMEERDRSSWFDAAVDAYAEGDRWRAVADLKYPSLPGGLNAKGS